MLTPIGVNLTPLTRLTPSKEPFDSVRPLLHPLTPSALEGSAQSDTDPLGPLSTLPPLTPLTPPQTTASLTPPTPSTPSALPDSSFDTTSISDPSLTPSTPLCISIVL